MNSYPITFLFRPNVIWISLKCFRPTFENLLILVCCRWNRLENLLVQGRKDRDFSAKDALQPVLKLLLAPDGEELRILVIKEAVRITEAFVLGTVIDSYNSIPDLVRALLFNGNASGVISMSNVEQQSMIELRDQVYRIWGLLGSSGNFDPSLFQPILQVGALILCILFSCFLFFPSLLNVTKIEF